jgi:hypothetical protein
MMRWGTPPASKGGPPVTNAVIEARASTMVDNNKRRRLVEFKDVAAMAGSEKLRLMS